MVRVGGGLGSCPPAPTSPHFSRWGPVGLSSACSKGLFLGLQPQVLEGAQSPGDSGGTSEKVSDGATRPSLLFGERRTSPLKGLQTRSDWRAPEPGRDAALSRSAGATGRGLAGRRRKSGSGAVERPFGEGTLSPQRLRSRRGSESARLPERARGAPAQPENSGCQPSARPPLPLRRNRWRSPGAVRVAGSILTTSFGRTQGPT